MNIRELEKLVVALRTCNHTLPSIVDVLTEVQNSRLPNRRNRSLSASDDAKIAMVQYLARILLVNDMECTTNQKFVDMIKSSGFDVTVKAYNSGSIQTKKGVIAYGD